MIIYTIRNKINGKQLIGQSVSTLQKRWRAHKREAFNNSHHNPHFQHAWNKYGEEAFVCELLDTAENIDELNALEVYYINITLDTYNIREGGAKGRLSEETKRRMSEVRKGWCQGPKYHSEETKRKMSDAARGNKRRLGKKHSAATRKKIGIKSKGRILSKETRKKISKSLEGNQHTKGKLMSLNTKISLHKKVTCPYCEMNSLLGTMKRWHFNNCKYKK